MIRFLMVISLVTFSLAITADAQNRSKLEPTRFQKQHMVQTLNMHAELLKDSDPSKRAIGVQNIRDLEYAYPDESFNNLLVPLIEKLRDEKENTDVRVLSVLALDGLHNDKGDKAIGEVSKTTGNQSVKELCNALLFSFSVTAGAQTPTRFQKQNMLQKLEMHADLLKDSDPLKRTKGVQYIRDLEYAYPNEPFSNLLIPLMERLKDKNETTQVRILSAIALDGLHSDTGDKAIEEMSQMSNNQSIKELCIALLVKE